MDNGRLVEDSKCLPRLYLSLNPKSSSLFFLSKKKKKFTFLEKKKEYNKFGYIFFHLISQKNLITKK